MLRSRLILLVSLILLITVAGQVTAQGIPDLKFEKYVLDNGLQVILHEDHTIPTVAVNIWYHVGSKNEKPGRTGFAHLFEHMMFQGSQHHDTDYFFPLQKIGGQVNGSTNKDRTNYWENVSADQLELALWLESDRMGWLLPAMTQDRLDNQMDVVRNEKRQGENNPYAKSDEMLLNLMYPGEHPYSWTIIGSMDDLGAATKEDVSEFFELYYAPNNASLCIAGDFNPAEAKRLVETYFGPIPPGAPVDRMQTWIPEMNEVRRSVAEDAVELSRLYMAWHTPGYYQPGDAEMDLLSDILTSGKTSRLYQRLVYELQIAQNVFSFQNSQEMSSEFQIVATAAPGADLAEIERVIDEELTLLLEKGIQKKELQLSQTTQEAAFVRGLQAVGGFGGKADRLNRYNTFTGDPDYLQQDIDRYRRITTKDLQAAANKYLDLGGRAILYIHPQGTLKETEDLAGRDQQPGSLGPVSFTPPEIQTTTLSNGLEIFLVEKHELPLIQLNLTLKSGWSADPLDKPGTAALMADMLDEGTKSRDALQISERARELAAQLGTGSFFDGTVVNLNVLKQNLDDGLALMSEVVLEPSFPEAELERLRQQYLGQIQQQSAQPVVAAIMMLQKKIFGEGHPYAQPFTGTGTAESLAELTRDDLIQFHERNFFPNNAAVVIAGDLTLAEARAAVEKAYKKWERGTVERPSVPTARSVSGTRVYIADRPGAQQSIVTAAHLSMNRNNPDFQAFNIMNLAFGGQFTSRVNMNLREDKGYTYGARANIASFAEAGLYFFNAPVHTEYTKETVFEILKECNDIRGTRPLSAEELLDSQNNLTMGFPQNFENYGGIAGQLGQLVQYNLPLTEWQTYLSRVRGTTSADIARVVAEQVRPDDLIFVIVGDADVITGPIEELNLGSIEVLEAGTF